MHETIYSYLKEFHLHKSEDDSLTRVRVEMGSRSETELDFPPGIKDKMPDAEPRPPNDGFRIQVSQPFIPQGAKERVLKAIDEGTISSATKVVDEFEDELRRHFSVPFAKACSSGFSALVLGLKLARIGTGHDVLVPSFTMAAVLNSVLTVGANPIFVDCAKGSFNPSIAEYEKRLTSKTRALVVTHTYGVPAHCSELQTFCKENDLTLIEDIAEAIGTDYNGKLVGTFGDFACASLYANKTITAGDGGFVLSTRLDEDLRDRANSYVNHGFTKGFHFVHVEASGNYKMSGLQAAFATPAVSMIPEVMEDRSRIAECYCRHLAGVAGLTLMPKNPYGKDAPWMFGVMVDSKETRTKVRQKLADAGIETRDYFFPLHLQPLTFALTGELIEPGLPNAEQVGTTGFYLPTFYQILDEDIQEICKQLKDALI